MKNIMNQLYKISFILILTTVILAGCEKSQPPIEKEDVPVTDKNKYVPKYRIVEIEGCEYFSFISSHGFKHITHKGNCKNPIHTNNTAKTTAAKK